MSLPRYLGNMFLAWFSPGMQTDGLLVMSSKSVVLEAFLSRKKLTRFQEKLQLPRQAAEEVGTASFNPRPPTCSGSVA